MKKQFQLILLLSFSVCSYGQIKEKTFELNENMDIGLGWHILKNKSDNLWYWHNGGTGGYSSSMAIDVKTKNGIIILSNVSAFNPNMGNIDKLCFELINHSKKNNEMPTMYMKSSGFSAKTKDK